MNKKIISTMIALYLVFNITLIFASISSEAETQFWNNADIPICVTEPSNSRWLINSAFSDSRIDCYKPEGIPETCCPSSGITTCNGVVANSVCVDNNISHCADIKDSGNCSGYYNIAGEDLKPILGEGVCNYAGDQYGNNGKCFDRTSCYCKWQDNKCQAVAEIKIYNSSYVEHSKNITKLQQFCNSTVNPSLGSCAFKFEIIDQCKAVGFLDRIWSVTPDYAGGATPAYCKPGDDRIPCLDAVRLGFFNLINFAIAIVIIALIYYFVFRKKGKKLVKNKSKRR